jgi:uridine phosphorylase
MRSLQGMTEEYRHLNILNYEMEAGTLFKMGNVYGFAAGCVCGVVAQRTKEEKPVLESKAVAVQRAIDVAVSAIETFA